MKKQKQLFVRRDSFLFSESYLISRRARNRRARSSNHGPEGGRVFLIGVKN
jgi:hypothetical protein